MLTVVVCEDAFAVLEVLAWALEGEGYRVLRAHDGAEALQLLGEHACDVLVTDDWMDGMSGRELVATMRADVRFAAIPVILMTNEPRADVAATLLAKPIRLTELFARIASTQATRRSP